MYGNPRIGVDKGVGFDFSSITDMVKSAATVGLNIYNQQTQLQQVKALAARGLPTALPTAGQYVGLPMNQALPGAPQPYYAPQGMSTVEILGIVAAVGVGGLLLMKALK